MLISVFDFPSAMSAAVGLTAGGALVALLDLAVEVSALVVLALVLALVAEVVLEQGHCAAGGGAMQFVARMEATVIPASPAIRLIMIPSCVRAAEAERSRLHPWSDR
jgi:hypothetical protein